MRWYVAPAIGMLISTAAHAQQPATPVCQSQQELEQLIQSGGGIRPDGCRTLSIQSIKTPAGTLCQINIHQPADPGVFDQLKGVVSQDTWWVECKDLGVPTAG